LIGNGTGIAGLRSHLKARMQAGHARNWLIFGERNRSRDFYYEDEIAAWQSGQWLQRVDLAFSRDQPERIYVQHILFEQAGALQAWITDGAAIYVCGSAEGMAQGVQAALVQILGQATLERLAEEGRYRRDVY
jgi:sulfite reductase (NADPH) flavoprotein alpha-component